MAGLVPFGDWVCGWAGGPLHGENSFYDLVEAVSNLTDLADGNSTLTSL